MDGNENEWLSGAIWYWGCLATSAAYQMMLMASPGCLWRGRKGEMGRKDGKVNVQV